MAWGIEADYVGHPPCLCLRPKEMPLTGAECKTARFPEGKPVQARLGSAAKMVRPAGESSNLHDAILQELADWDAELTRLNSPALRKIGEAKP